VSGEKTIHAKDLSPLPEDLSAADIDWLRQLQRHLHEDDRVLRLGDSGQEPDEIVACNAEGRWFAGRYIGSVVLAGRRLEITPRYSDDVIRGWLSPLTNVVVATGAERHERSSALIPRLLAMLWTGELERATRHGLPFLREDRAHVGLRVRGRIDPSATARLGARRHANVASRTSERSVSNAISITVVLAQRALKQMNSGDWWMTKRASDVMPHLWEAVGTRPRPPRRRDLDRIRYTPIRRPYEALVELSWQILSRGGFSSAGSGEVDGLLLDMAELWERFVLTSLRRAASSDVRVIHGARESLGRREYLLRSEDDPTTGLARMYPDIVVRRGEQVIAIVDAKYKRLTPRRTAPLGVTTDDAHQIAAYVATLRADNTTVGMLAYPCEPGPEGESSPPTQQRPSPSEDAEPWLLPALGNRIRTRRLSVLTGPCTAELKELELASSQGAGRRRSSPRATPATML